MTVSPLWLQGSILTFIVGFSLLTFSAIRIYQDYAPIPERIVDEAGNVLFTRQQILDGQELFLTYGLMQFGTVYGHGACLGPDFTADYLHRMALHMNKRYGDDEAARERTRLELRPTATTHRRGHWSGRRGRSRPSRRSTTTSASWYTAAR
jgi:nitric oxide reductase subunit B